MFLLLRCSSEKRANNTLFIAPSGNDTWSGRLAEPNRNETDGPFATFQKAQETIRELKKMGRLPADGVTVYVRKGNYSISKTIKLTTEDSGEKNAPITWCSYPDERVVFSGGKTISGFIKIRDAEILKRIKKAYHDSILVCDLQKLEILDNWKLRPEGFTFHPHKPLPMELFFNDDAMTLARYPNEGWLEISDVPQFGKEVIHKGCLPHKRFDIPVGKHFGRFKYETDRPEHWHKTEDIWMHGYWSWDWADTYNRIEKIDVVKKEIYPATPCSSYGYTKGQRFYFINVLEELDSPGEYYINRKTGKLYFWPPENINKGEVTVSIMYACSGKKPDDLGLKQQIQSNEYFAFVNEKALEIVTTGFNAGDGYGEVWIRDYNTFIELSSEVSEPDILKEKAEENRGRLVLNEDNSHFFGFGLRTGDDMTVDGLKELVDHYVKGTQVRQLMFSPNSMCASYASEVWDPIWHGYDDPEAAKKAGANDWQVNALLLHKRGIDPYAVWIAYSRELDVSPWLSMRMNDIHNVDDPNSYMHRSFWKENPHLRRVPDHFSGLRDRAFDYGQKAVRDNHMAFIRELFERYDFDGLELDWMRFGYHFRPGHEEEGVPLLTEFMTEVRRLADEHAIRRGHPIKIGARVPTRPWTAKGLGMDAITWAKKGLIDMLVVTPFWSTMETDIPIEKWKELLGNSPVVLAAGLELGIHPYPAARIPFRNNAETVMGAAVSLLHRGADLIYLFNYMDSGTTVDSPDDYTIILQNAGALKTATTHPRRHVITYSDTWAPGEPEIYTLPILCGKDKNASLKIHIGPRPKAGNVRVFIGLGEEGNCDTTPLKVRVNGELCAASESAPPTHIHPVVKTMAGFDVPLYAIKDGYNRVEVASSATEPGKIVWVEIYIIP